MDLLDSTIEPNFFEERMKLLGIDPKGEQNIIRVRNPEAEFPMKTHEDCHIFSEDDKGNIRILVYDITGDLVTYEKMGDGKMSHINARTVPYYITRLKQPYKDKKGRDVKYLIPKGIGTYPFFPPSVVEKYKNKESIPVLVLTEGYFKAFKGAMHGLDIVGLSSITHYKDKETGGIHADILKIIRNCGTKVVIWLVDGDCNTLSESAINEGEDIFKKPNGFFSSSKMIKQLLEDVDVEKYFAHVMSDSLEGYPKGLDDLLIEGKDAADVIAKDLTTFSRPGTYFYRENITFSLGKLHRYFRLHSVNEFFMFHAEKYHSLKDKEFVWHGTKYKWDEEKQTCNIIVPADAKKFFRVGDQYHEKLEIPNKYQQLEKTFHRRQKSTITDDFGKKIIEHIPKYKAFCNVPDHINYQEVIHSCYNVYAPFEHEPEEGECPATIEFLKHIFGPGTIRWKHPKTGEIKEIPEVELGLDYIQLLYQRPQQILPILCLVSRENGTGKSTFAKWLKMIFTHNAAVVGNAELADNFNASWASKLLVICDEAKIDKQVVVEKVKALSTADKIFMNAKGKDHVEIDFFGKFIFLTNNEQNFIYASDDDVRYWVRKVPVIRSLNVRLLSAIQEEIPAFLNFLNKRKMATEEMHRAWFDPELIKTEALKKVIAHSLPTIEKELRSNLREKFLDFGCDVIMMTPDTIRKEFFNNKYEKNYIEDVLRERLKADTYHKLEYEGEQFKSLADLIKKHKDYDPGKVQKKYLVHRFNFPRWENKVKDGGMIEQVRVDVSGNGRPFVFHVDQFLTREEIETRHIDQEHRYANELMEEGKQKDPEELPF